MKDFFVSYTSADKAWAGWIAYVLEDEGYSVTLQEWDFRPGSNFAVEMDKALKECRRVIAVLSSAYLGKPFATAEWAAAFATDPVGAENRLVPIMVEECEPHGLLAQVVQIRIQGNDEATSRKQILRGVRPERNKPATPPLFPGPSATAPTRPASPVPFPGAVQPASTTSAGRLRWRTPSTPVVVSWRRELDQRIRGQFSTEAVEVHLAFPGDDARLQVSELRDLENVLPDHGRRSGFFTRLEALTSEADSTVARAASSGWGNEKGLAVSRTGQRSAWAPLPRGQVSALLDVDHLVGQVTGMIGTLIALDLPHGQLVVPAIGLDPARAISYGSVAAPSNTATLGHRQPEYVHVAAEEAVGYTDLTSRVGDVAAELVARLVADHRNATGLR